MKVVILGGGLMGSAAAGDLAKDPEVEEIVVNDIDEDRLEEVKSIDPDKISCTSVDVTDIEETAGLLEGTELAINALPHELSLPALNAALEAETDVVDMVFEDDQMELDDRAKEAGVLIIPGCGFAPGISNVLVKYGAEKLDSPEEGHIRVGGLPLNPEPPLGYKVVFRLDSVWNEYVRDATVVKDGEVTEVEALAEYETFDFPELGELECAITDGLASLSYTMEEVETLDEKTIRYPGHYEKIETLVQCGLLDREPVEVEGCEVAPRALLTELLAPDLQLEEGEKDVSIMVVDVKGTEDGQDKTYKYGLLDYYDEEEGVTSMGRTTAYTATITARMLANGEIGGSGVVPPENILDAEKLISRLGEKGIEIEEM